MDVQAAKTLRKTVWALDFHCLFAPLGAHQPGFFRVKFNEECLPERIRSAGQMYHE